LFQFSNHFCLERFSFYDSLLWSILALVAAICVLLLMYKIAVIKHTRSYGGTLPENYYLHRTYALLIVYLLLFAYPVASVKLVKAFSCHEINGVSYLRAAYDVCPLLWLRMAENGRLRGILHRYVCDCAAYLPRQAFVRLHAATR
jgi:hypothetical protein